MSCRSVNGQSFSTTHRVDYNGLKFCFHTKSLDVHNIAEIFGWFVYKYISTQEGRMRETEIFNNSSICEVDHHDDSSIVSLPFVISCMALIFILGFLGNAVVIYIVAKKRRMQTHLNWMILNVAVSDLLVVTFCIPFDIPLLVSEKWLYGKFICSVYYPIGTAILLSSVFTLVVINYSRYWVIAHPFKAEPSLFMAKIQISACWILGIILTLPLPIVLTYDPECQLCYEGWTTTTRKWYTVAIFVFGYAGPLSVIIVVYAVIINDLVFKRKRKPSYRDTRIIKENKNLIKLALTITLTFTVCVLPNQLVFLLQDFGALASYRHEEDMIVASHLLLFLNSALNPILYNAFARNFRREFKRVMLDMFSSTGKSRMNRLGSLSRTQQGRWTLTRVHVVEDDGRTDAETPL